MPGNGEGRWRNAGSVESMSLVMFGKRSLCPQLPFVVSCLALFIALLVVHGQALVCFVGWLLNVPAAVWCISGTDLLRQFYVLPH